MMVRISLILAILLGLAATGLNVAKVKEKITTLQTNLATETEAHKKFEDQYRRTKSDLDKTNAVLKTTQETLKATEEEKNQAVATAAAQTKKAEKLTEDLTKTRAEKEAAQQEVSAYRASGLSPQQAATAAKEIKHFQETVAAMDTENKVLVQKVAQLNNKLKLYELEGYEVPLPAGLKGTVTAVDPKWNFIVLNVGGDQGVLEKGELLVNRSGKLVAKVRVSSVQKGSCVANVVPGWQLGEVMEGDMAIPAHPSS
jgi:hypothetical protein